MKPHSWTLINFEEDATHDVWWNYKCDGCGVIVSSPVGAPRHLYEQTPIDCDESLVKMVLES